MAFKVAPSPAVGRVVHVPAGQGQALDVMGTSIATAISGEHSAGALNLFEIFAPPGSFVPPHLHRREDETFYVLAGELEAESKGVVERVGVGGSLFLPRSVVHTWRTAGPSPCRFLLFSNPAGMDRYFPEIATQAGKAPPTPEQVVQISRKYGIEFV